MNFLVPHQALIVIANGAHAAVYRNVSSSGIKIEKENIFSSPVENNRGPSRMPVEISPHEKNEANFAKDLADNLYKHLHDSKMKALVLVADPQTLGQLRPMLHKEVSGLITGELHKDLVKSPVADIEKILTAAQTS